MRAASRRAGSTATGVSASQPATAHCNANASATPSTLANTPSSSISPTWMATSVRWLAPRQRITAAPDRWRALWRRAAIATATAASTTDTSAARPRKRLARVSAERISGRAWPMVSRRWPRPSAASPRATKRSVAVGIAGDDQAVADAAAFLHELGGGQIFEVEEHLGRDVEVVERGVGFLHHQRDETQLALRPARRCRRSARPARRRRRGSSTPCRARGWRRRCVRSSFASITRKLPRSGKPVPSARRSPRRRLGSSALLRTPLAAAAWLTRIMLLSSTVSARRRPGAWAASRTAPVIGASARTTASPPSRRLASMASARSARSVTKPTAVTATTASVSAASRMRMSPDLRSRRSWRQASV